MKTKVLYSMITFTFIFLILFIIYLLKPMTMNDIYDKPNFKGVVTKTSDTSILVLVNEDEAVYKSSDLINVSLDVKLKDSMTQFKVGERISVYYDGIIAESYPAQVNNVYAIILGNSNDTKNDLIPMVFINDKLFYDTGKEIAMTRCGVMDGKILSTVERFEIPTQENQSNFGEGYEYQFIDEQNISILINNKLFKFNTKE